MSAWEAVYATGDPKGGCNGCNGCNECYMLRRMNRRKFIGAALTGIVGASVTSAPGVFAQAASQRKILLYWHGVANHFLTWLTNILNEVGGYPTYNFQQGRFTGAATISGETMAETEKKRGGGGHE